MYDDMTRITLTELCEWLNVDVEWVKAVRRGRDASLMPPPICDGEGLTWLEADVLTWLSYWFDRQEMVAAGEDPAALPTPTYFVVEPELRNRSEVGQ